ncbi:MAG: sugar transferase, partial [Candidatus Omnitrophica bacterium]|nr:sugar transferase [Candidatus Omnitrophota bacterium]
AEEWQLFIKRVVDISVSLPALVILSPLIALTGVLIKITSSGPIFFKQRRVTLNGRIFTLYKFRSMYEGAEKDKEALEFRNEMTGPVFKIKDDPRITPLGRFLRKTSIDELPQLFNVLKGDISLVGPRPLPVEEVNKFEFWQRRRQSMRSGITCLWQISGRSEVGFEKWMELDLYYIDNWSLGLDFKILLKTIPVVLMGRGAH